MLLLDENFWQQFNTLKSFKHVDKADVEVNL